MTDLEYPQNEYIEVFDRIDQRFTIPSGAFPFQNKFYNGVHVFIDVTAVSAVGFIQFNITGQDASSVQNYTLISTALISTVGTRTLTLYPGIPDIANEQRAIILPPQWAMIAAHFGTNPFSYKVSANVIL